MEAHLSHHERVLIICCGVLLVATVISAYANIQLKFDSWIGRTQCDTGFLYSRRYLLFGILLAAVGGGMDLVVIAYIPMSLRSCFSSLSIPISVMLARFTLNERVSRAQLIGVMITVVGSMGAGLFASHETSVHDSAPEVFGFLSNARTRFLAIFTVPLLILSLVASFRASSLKSVPRYWHLIICAYGTAFIGASVSLGGKLLSFLINEHGYHSVPFLTLSIIMVAGSVLQVSLMSAFLSQFEASRALPLYQVINSVLLSVFAAVIFSEPIPNIPGYILGNLISFFGLWLVSRQSSVLKEKVEIELMDSQPLMVLQKSHSLSRKELLMLI